MECARVLACIRELYAVERSASDKRLGDNARKELRQSSSRPILERLRAYLDGLAETALPKSPLGQAVAYTRKN